MKRGKLLLFSLTILVTLTGCNQGVTSEKLKQPSSLSSTEPVETLHGPYKVSKVTDGDTIHVIRDGADIKVRIIGVNTPEVWPNIQCFGPEASAFAKSQFQDSSVYLEYDSTQSELDRWGRVLAHVWTSSKQLYAAEAIKQGFTPPPQRSPSAPSPESC